MVRAIIDNKWVDFIGGLEQACKLFVPQDTGMMTDVQPRTEPLTLEDGTVITHDSAIKTLLTIAVQKHLDATAQLHGYDNIHTAALRAGYPGPFHDEGVRYATWMDAVWTYAIQVLADVTSGARGVPTTVNLIAELPAFV